MDDIDITAPPRERQSIRGWALVASAGIALTALVPIAGAAGADTYIDPNDRCLPDSEAPPAPVSDRARISPVHVQSVDCIFAEGISLGRADGTFGPRGMTTRAQMASFIVRALEAAGYTVPAAGDQGFTDIAGNTHEDAINRLAAINVTLGKTSTTYAPRELVRRDQMASFMVRAAEFAFDDPEFLVGEERVPAFPDVPPRNVHYDNVNSGARVLGLVAGKTTGLYDPRSPTQRQQMASFLVRLVDLTLIVE